MQAHYSGPQSKKIWKKINRWARVRHRNADYAMLFVGFCILQDVETKMLKLLDNVGEVHRHHVPVCKKCRERK